MAQLVKHLTLGFGSGHELMVHEFQSWLDTDSAEPAWDSLSPFLSAPTPLMLSLKSNKKN